MDATTPRQPCERCGAFDPLLELDGEHLCEACIGRRLDPVIRSPLEVGDILGGSVRTLRQMWVAGAVLVCAFEVPIEAAHYFFPDLPQAAEWGFNVVRIIPQAAVYVLAHAVLMGRPQPSLGESLSTSAGGFQRMVGPYFFSTILIFLGFFALIVPGIIAALSLTLVIPVALHEPNVNVLGASHGRMKGHRWVALGAYLVAAVPVIVVAGGAVVVGVVLGLGLGEFADPDFFAGLENFETSPTWLAVEGVIGVLAMALAVPLHVVTAVLYAGTQPELSERAPSDATALDP